MKQIVAVIFKLTSENKMLLKEELVTCLFLVSYSQKAIHSCTCKFWSINLWWGVYFSIMRSKKTIFNSTPIFSLNENSTAAATTTTTITIFLWGQQSICQHFWNKGPNKHHSIIIIYYFCSDSCFALRFVFLPYLFFFFEADLM